jgi:hypothetical protein
MVLSTQRNAAVATMLREKSRQPPATPEVSPPSQERTKLPVPLRLPGVDPVACLISVIM